MKLFKVFKRCSDTCGNSWYTHDYYIRAKSKKDIEKHFPKYSGFGGWDIFEVNELSLEEAIEKEKDRVPNLI